jgi:ribonucleotide reductase alpha subunit
MPFDETPNLFRLSADTAHMIDEVRRDKYMQPSDGDWRGTATRVANAIFHDDLKRRVDLEHYLWEQIACPAGRVMAGVGSGKNVTFANCFVAPLLQDSMRTDPSYPGLGIMDCLASVAYTMQMGGGVGTDFSPLRPQGALVQRVGAEASGPLAFMDTWDAMCRTILSAGYRRGAMMATLRIDHPDILKFIEAKHDPNRLRMFNISVLVTEEFIQARENDADWELGHWEPPFDSSKALAVRQKQYQPVASVYAELRPWYVYQTIKARDLWERLTRSTYVYSEPGVIYIDRVNQWNNLYYCEIIHTSNPCFTGDTKVWTVNGPVRFDQLVDGTPVLTELKDGLLAYRRMDNPRVTQRSAELVEVVFSAKKGKGGKKISETSVRVTPQHEFFLVGGGRRRAIDLRPNDRIESAYRTRANQKGYIAVRSTGGDRVLEHHLIAEYDYGSRPMWPLEHGHHVDNADPVYKEKLKTAIRAGAAKMSPKARSRNHKVVSVTKLFIKEDVYCGTVPATGRFFVFLGDDHYEGVLVSNCGEQMLPPDQNCNLSHINLSRCVTGELFTSNCSWDFTLIREVVPLLVRMSDRIIDLTPWPTEAQRLEAFQKRRIGLGVTGLANALMFMGLRYGSPEAVKATEAVMAVIRDAAYLESIELAKENGPFPAFEQDSYLEGRFVQTLRSPTQEEIRKHGIRNSHLLTIAPTGTISIAQADNSSGGLEPVFLPYMKRNVLQPDGSFAPHTVEDFGFRVYANKMFDGDFEAMMASKLPDFMVCTEDLTIEDHLQMQAVVQKYVDSSISKTINVPTNTPYEEFVGVYDRAYELGCKGCTTYRPVPESGRGAVLSAVESKASVLQTPIELRKRDDALSGTTYRLRWGGLPSPLFLTVNDEVTEDGRRVPFEVFINTKAVESAHWVAAVTRLISSVMRSGIDLTFLPDELKQVHSARGGEWRDGQFVPSEVALIGLALERHFRDIGYMSAEEKPVVETVGEVRGRQCPSCGQLTLVRIEGCDKCTNCTYNKCG